MEGCPYAPSLNIHKMACVASSVSFLHLCATFLGMKMVFPFDKGILFLPTSLSVLP
ncbi:MAG: hypothetical protein ACI815_001287 [Psychroserpens sp.]|jgi:hypothetical protein